MTHTISRSDHAGSLKTSGSPEIAVFGGGCFWCTEAVFNLLKGVQVVEPGYGGGTTPNPTYHDVCGGGTGHAEVVKIEFDPRIVSFETLLTLFFASHDPTTLNRQGNDVGTQYRSVIFFTSPMQQAVAQRFIDDLNTSARKGDPIVTQLVPLDTFYPAEEYHRDYFAHNKMAPYCQVVINPKLEKVQRAFTELLKDIHS